MKTLALVLCLGFSALAFADDAKLDVDGFKFTLPAGWKSVEPSSAMRKAEVQITVSGLDKPLTAVVFHFPGGDVDQNITRWKGQLTGTVESKTEEVDAGGTKVTMFQGTGTYTDPFGGLGAQENFALIGVLVPVADSGPIVIKLAGPKDATLGLYDTLKKLAQSAAK